MKHVGHATPTLLLEDGRVVAALGAPCGRRVVTAMFQTIDNMVDFGMDVQEAVAAPRLHCERADPSDPLGLAVHDVRVDDRMPAEALADLARRGHTVLTCRETETQSFLGKPLGVQYIKCALVGGVDISGDRRRRGLNVCDRAVHEEGARNGQRPLPLKGVRVVSVEQYGAGPFAIMHTAPRPDATVTPLPCSQGSGTTRAASVTWPRGVPSETRYGRGGRVRNDGGTWRVTEDAGVDRGARVNSGVEQSTARHVEQDWPGGSYEDFRVGVTYEHVGGRTVEPVANAWYTLLTNNTNEVHYNTDAASTSGLFGRRLVNSCLTVVTDLSVSGVSRNDAANMGWDDVWLPAPVFEGDTLRARSTVLETRPSRPRPETGIVTVRTEEYSQEGTVSVTFRRSVRTRALRMSGGSADVDAGGPQG